MGEKLGANPVNGTVAYCREPSSLWLRPALSVSQDFGTRNGSLGVGWKLLLPAKTRKTEKRLPRYDRTEEVATKQHWYASSF
jgi:hypothetical protein